MKRALPVVLLAFACAFVPVRPAEAQSGIIRWIEKLSGPGPLWAAGVELYPFCVGNNTGRARNRGGDQRVQGAAPSEVTAALDVNCRAFSRRSVLFKAGFQYAQLWGDNQLEYDPSVPASLSDTVYGNLYAVTGDFTVLTGRVDVGGSLGWMHFTGTPAGTETHPLHEIRGTFNIVPIVTGGATDVRAQEWYRRDWLQFRLSMNIVPGGLQDTDFGAVPGSFPRTEAEFSVRPTILINLSSAFDW